MKKNKGLTILANEYAVANKQSEHPVMISLGVTVCTAVAIMVKDEFNSSSMAHFFAHVVINNNPEKDIKNYVTDGISRMVSDLNLNTDREAICFISGGIKGWGKHDQSELISTFTKESILKIPNISIVSDTTLLGNASDLYLNAVTGEIRALENRDFNNIIFDNINNSDDYSKKEHRNRLSSIDSGINNINGTILSKHCLGLMP